MNQTCIRGIPVLIVNREDVSKLDEYKKIFHKAYTIVSKYIFDNFSFKQNIPNKTTVYTFNKLSKINGIFLNTLISKNTKELLKNIGVCKACRNITQIVLANYNSYIKRNKQMPKSPLTLKQNKGIRFDDSYIKINGNTITIPGLTDNITVKFIYPGTTYKNQKYITRTKLGGNFNKRKNTWIFTIKYEKPIHYIYEPKNWIGTDFNKDSSGVNWIVLAEENTQSIGRPQEIADIEGEIKQVNDILRDRINTKGGKRRYFNNKRVKLHKQHKKLIRPIVQNLINIAKEKEAGISIDDVKTGQISGTWSQDKLISLLIEMCENQGIPYFVNNPAYTSQTCPQCGHRDKKNRSGELFKCQKCNYENNSHYVGAINCRNNAIRNNVQKCSVE